MPVVEIGRICIKTHGRESGKECIIIDIIDKSFVLITGPKSISGVKRRRVNISHLEPTKTVLDISRGATDEEVEKALIEMKKTE
jgi:large subunit ribosomal protein L14e